MVGRDTTKEVLEYLKNEGSTNTFKIARTMGLERDKLLTLIGRLEEKGAVKCERGNVIFLKFPSERKAIAEPKKEAPPAKLESSNEKLKIREFLQSENLRSENKQLQRKVVQMEKTMKELERKASAAPKTVTRTVIKKVPVTKTIVRRISVPRQPAETKVWEQLKAHSEQFKRSGSQLLENMKQLREPEFMRL